MKTTEAIINRIVELCAERNISLNKLATMSGLSPSSLKAVLYGRSKNPTVKTIKILCDGLGITLGKFFSTDEFDSLEQEIE